MASVITFLGYRLNLAEFEDVLYKEENLNSNIKYPKEYKFDPMTGKPFVQTKKVLKFFNRPLDQISNSSITNHGGFQFYLDEFSEYIYVGRSLMVSFSDESVDSFNFNEEDINIVKNLLEKIKSYFQELDIPFYNMGFRLYNIFQ